MPRKSLPAEAVAPISALQPPPPPSPIIQALRKDWRWAGVSQFVWTFSDAFGLVDWDIETLEADFDGDENRVIPTLVAKLLFALTYNRQINRENAFENLRKQYLKRKPEQNPFGTEEEPLEWATLGLGQKVQSLWDLCEWQLEDPARFRGLLKSEEEAASWRVDPIGWDKAGNIYYLFDDNRLWIQRIPPPPPRPAKKTSQKAKKAIKRSRPSTNSQSASASESASAAPAAKRSHRKREQTPEPLLPAAQPEELILSSSRRRSQVQFYGNPTPTALALKRGGTATTPQSTAGIGIAYANGSGSGSRPTRSSARHNGTGPSGAAATPSKAGAGAGTSGSAFGSASTPLPLGTRVSRRLRNVDDEWQKIPDEWLSPVKSVNGNGDGTGGRKGKGRKRDEDEESELSELTDEDVHEARVRAIGIKSESVQPRPQSLSRQASLDAQEGEVVDEDVVVDEQIRDEATKESPGQLESGMVKPNGHELARNDHTEANTTAVVAGDGQAESEAPQDDDVVMEDAEQEISTTAEDDDGVVPETAEVKVKEDDIVDAGESAEAKVETQDGEEAQGPKAGNGESTVAQDEVKAAVQDAKNLPEGFVEWEAICVTLYDWRTWPEQFAKSRDPDERDLYDILTNQAGPTIIAALVVKEQERIKQELVNNRKRSSRIAVKELEREEQQRHEQAEKEMEERMERSRKEEIRKAREEKELLAREKAREDRLKEREERATAREEALARKAEEEARVKERAERERERRKRRREGMEVDGDSQSEGEGDRDGYLGVPSGVGDQGVNGRGATPGQSATPERWELNCEVCKKVGWNIDGDLDVVCCDDCGRWQHVECHDRLDRSEGRPQRNWDKVDFQCKDCRRRAARNRQRPDDGAQSSPNGSGAYHSQANGNGYGNGDADRNGASPYAVSAARPLIPEIHTHRDPMVYPLIPGSEPGPSPPYDPARPPPPALGEGEYYAAHPHPASHSPSATTAATRTPTPTSGRANDGPAGFAIYYEHDQSHRQQYGQGPNGHATTPVMPGRQAFPLQQGFGTMPHPQSRQVTQSAVNGQRPYPDERMPPQLQSARPTEIIPAQYPPVPAQQSAGPLHQQQHAADRPHLPSHPPSHPDFRPQPHQLPPPSPSSRSAHHPSLMASQPGPKLPAVHGGPHGDSQLTPQPISPQNPRYQASSSSSVTTRSPANLSPLPTYNAAVDNAGSASKSPDYISQPVNTPAPASIRASSPNTVPPSSSTSPAAASMPTAHPPTAVRDLLSLNEES